MARNGVVRLTVLLVIVAVIFVTSGCQPETVDVPDVAGMTRADAEDAVISAGLLAGEVTEAFSDMVPNGCVISQCPKAGTKVDRGSDVDLTVSLGPDPGGRGRTGGGRVGRGGIPGG